MATIPTGLQDALNSAFSAKGDADQAKVDEQAAKVALAQAQGIADAAGETLEQKKAALDDKRKQLEAVLDVYLQPGATLPAPAPEIPAGT